MMEKETLPREKIAQDGVEKLTLPELLQIILGSGTKYVSAQTLAKKLADKVTTHGNHLSLSELTKIKGIGVAKASQVLAVIEIVERLRPSGYPIIDSVAQVIAHVGELRHAEREHLICLYLNARMQLVLKETLAIGSGNQAVLTPKDIFRMIKHHPVAFIILVHNHPSGNCQPSAEDLKFTDLIANGGKVLGVELLDHLIITQSTHYSLKEHHHFETEMAAHSSEAI